jgi:hypothetical protein
VVGYRCWSESNETFSVHRSMNYARSSVIIALAALVATGPAFANVSDADENGIPDSVDETLISTYRPHFYYDSDEWQYWPCSFDWLVRHSELWFARGGSDLQTPMFYNEELSVNPSLILSPNLSPFWRDFFELSCATNGYFDHVGYHLHLQSSACYGEGPMPVGTYAHVVQLSAPIVKPNYPNVPGVQAGDLLVQYWQVFGYNDPDALGVYGKHEGDLVYMEVYLKRNALTNPSPDQIRGIVHHHHGDGKCPPTLIPGYHDVGDYGTIFVPLPPDGIPKCYLEDGTHEFWPFMSSGAECTFGPFDWNNCGHNGLGVDYRTENVVNLGQRFAPMPGDEIAMILFFNGQWGETGDPDDGTDAPLGPVLQFYPESPMFVAYVSQQAPTWPRPEGVGSRYFPYQNILDAKTRLDQTMSSFQRFGCSGRLVLKAGDYPGEITFDQPMIIEPWGTGTVVIGN